METAPLKVLYIGGYSRSGSTILTNAIGEVDGYFGAGEVMAVWDQYLADAPCGCGEPVSACPIWSETLKSAFGEPDRSHFEEMRRLRNSEWQSSKVPRWLFQQSYRRRLTAKLGPYLDALGEVYRALGEVVPGEVIVDSSKNPAYLYFLSLVPGIDIRFVHIVRDPRATAYSWKRQKEGFESHGVWESVKSWNARNAMLAMLGNRAVSRYLRVRYEDFAADPQATLGAITRFTGEPRSGFPFLQDGLIHLTGNHLVYGNPDLFRSGSARLTLDDRWKDGLGAGSQLAVVAASFPLMWRFGYPLLPARGRGA